MVKIATFSYAELTDGAELVEENYKPWELTSRAVGKVLQIREKSSTFAASK